MILKRTEMGRLVNALAACAIFFFATMSFGAAQDLPGLVQDMLSPQQAPTDSAPVPSVPPLSLPNAERKVDASLVSEVSGLPVGGEVWVGLRQKIPPGWHTYWRNPGDSGEPTHIEWQLPDGFSAGEIQWPAPHRLPYGPLVNFGYKDEVLLLTRIKAPADLPVGEPVTLRGHARWLVCEEICIPEDQEVALTLVATSDSPGADPAWAELFENTRRALPQPAPWPTTVATGSDGLRLSIDASLPADRVSDVAFFPYEDGWIDNAAEQEARIGAEALTVDLQPGYRPLEGILEGIIVIEEALETGTARQAFRVVAEPVLAPAGLAGPDITVLNAFLFALMGGLILNLMPCVFPVLSMKALALAAKAHGERQHAAIGGAVFTLGVLVSFAAIAGSLIALQAGGTQVGWGFQLQSPVFVTLLAYLLFAVGLSLSGVFAVGSSLMGIGGNLSAVSGHRGAFLTGVLAAIVATPCTAPFMGAAIGFALTQPAAVSMGVFLALSLGMALPYLLLSLFPSLLRFLPRPGAWMERLKQALAFPMYASAIWLVWVLSQQTGPQGVLVALAGILLIAFAAWLHGATREGARGWRVTGAVGASAAVILALVLVRLPAPAPSPASPVATASLPSDGLAYEPYSADRLAQLRRENRAVFVNFTAAWCVTCLVNDRVALATQEVADAFARWDVAYLKGDWTNRDPEITAALREFGRSGVPLYVFYPPADSGRDPIVLPQILTEAAVVSTLDSLNRDIIGG